MPLSRRAPLVALALVSIACGSVAVSLEEGPRRYTADDYEDVYERWTRTVDEFHIGNLEQVIRATATFQSWDFRWAYVVRYAHDFRFSTMQRTRMLEHALRDAQEHHRFFLTMSGRYRREADLTGEQRAWRVLLVNADGDEVEPDRIERVSRPGAAERIYFPTVSPYRLTFRLSFPVRDPRSGQPFLQPHHRYFTLRFAGALGAVDLRWNIFGSGRHARRG
ncbi:MAG: hypothetical protein IT379_00910 [Deltaproteobacteria bacterium]|nr:hypothetical protein [Deltaproteobacteria bacterium]